jgi:hypothetical protein
MFTLLFSLKKRKFFVGVGVGFSDTEPTDTDTKNAQVHF